MAEVSKRLAEQVYSFYSAFNKKDFRSMREMYHSNAEFSDQVFTKLCGAEIGKMWEMLCVRGQDLQVECRDVVVHENVVTANWEARYAFSKTGRNVHNCIRARFEFRHGKIMRHVDDFNFWRWSRMALGPIGWLLGWSPLLKQKVRAESAKALKHYASRSEQRIQ